MPRSSVMDKDEKDSIESLQQQVGKLKSQNTSLNNKVVQITDELEKKKRELNLAKKTAYLGKSRTSTTKEPEVQLEILPGKNPFMDASRRLPPPAPHGALQVPTDGSLLEVARKYKQR